MTTKWKADWFLSSLLDNHITEMVNRYSALLASRVDFSYKKNSLNFNQPDHHQLERDIRTLMECMMSHVSVVGYFWVIEYGEDKRYHAHVVFWLDKHITQSSYVYTERARGHWEEITLKMGVFHRCEFNNRYKANINIPVRYDNPASICNIRRVLSYLAKEEQKLDCLLYGCNEVPAHSGQGRPRENAAFNYLNQSVRYSI